MPTRQVLESRSAGSHVLLERDWKLEWPTRPSEKVALGSQDFHTPSLIQAKEFDENPALVAAEIAEQLDTSEKLDAQRAPAAPQIAEQPYAGEKLHTASGGLALATPEIAEQLHTAEKFTADRSYVDLARAAPEVADQLYMNLVALAIRKFFSKCLPTKRKKR